MDKFQTNVTVHREKNETKFRPVEIEGQVHNIIDTVFEINRSMEFYIQKKNREHQEEEDESYLENKISSKLVFNRIVETFFKQEFQRLNSEGEDVTL